MNGQGRPLGSGRNLRDQRRAIPSTQQQATVEDFIEEDPNNVNYNQRQENIVRPTPRSMLNAEIPHHRESVRYHPYETNRNEMQRASSTTKIPSRIWNRAQIGERQVLLAIKKRVIQGIPLNEPLASYVRALNNGETDANLAAQTAANQKTSGCVLM